MEFGSMLVIYAKGPECLSRVDRKKKAYKLLFKDLDLAILNPAQLN